MAVIFGVGIIAVLLYSQGFLGVAFYVPFWVILTCQAAMGFGTLFGGWRIVHTMGSKLPGFTLCRASVPRWAGRWASSGDLSWHPRFYDPHITGAIIGVGAAARSPLFAGTWQATSCLDGDAADGAVRLSFLRARQPRLLRELRPTGGPERQQAGRCGLVRQHP